ncbi:MAG: DUF4276 family protein, partial [Methanothrix sp.]|nr:DUF4276 family protein [Methanothrix sp.]
FFLKIGGIMSYKDDDIRTIETIGLHNLLSFGPDTESISLKAYDMFHNAVISAEDGEYPILLVDSEDPITSGPWDHLKVLDCWDRPVGTEDDQAQMMTTCMETWIMADHEALRKVFGSCLMERALIPTDNLEERSRQELLQALKSATRDCGKRKGYDKGKRSFQILAELNTRSLEENLHYFRRLKKTLGRHL